MTLATGILVNPEARRTNHYHKCVEVLKRLAAYKKGKEKEQAPRLGTDQDDSETNEPPTQCPSRSGTPKGRRVPSDMDIVVDLTKPITGPRKFPKNIRGGSRESTPYNPGAAVERSCRGLVRSADPTIRVPPNGPQYRKKQPAPPGHQAESSSDDERNNSDEKRWGVGVQKKDPEIKCPKDDPRTGTTTTGNHQHHNADQT